MPRRLVSAGACWGARLCALLLSAAVLVPSIPATADAADSFDYGVGDGTSYAAPHVTALAAMWLRHRGPEIEELYGTEGDRWMIVEAFRRLLRQTQLRPPFKAPDGCRAGMLNGAALLKAKLPKPATLRYEEDRAGDDRA